MAGRDVVGHDAVVGLGARHPRPYVLDHPVAIGRIARQHKGVGPQRRGQQIDHGVAAPHALAHGRTHLLGPLRIALHGGVIRTARHVVEGQVVTGIGQCGPSSNAQ